MCLFNLYYFNICSIIFLYVRCYHLKKLKRLFDKVNPKIKDIITKGIKLSKDYVKTNVLFMSFVILALINGMLLRSFTVGGFFNIDPFLADLAVILIIGALGYFFKPKNQYKYYIIILTFLAAICMINSVYYTNYLTFASVSMIKTSTQLGGVANAVFEEIMEWKDILFLLTPIALYMIHHRLRKKKYYDSIEEFGKVKSINTIVGGLIILGFFLTTVTGTDLSRLGKQWNREYIVGKFGIYTYQLNDLVATVKSKLMPLFGYDEALKEFREFYASKETEEVKKNKYTNILKNKNVIVIHAESIQNFLINATINGQEITPNLNKLAKEGIYASNFYAQESVGTSSDSEFTYATSLLPASSGTVFISYWDREYVSIQQLLNEQGYYTFSMHGNNGSFWNRNVGHLNTLGYQHYFAYKDAYNIDETIGLGLSDKSFFRQSVPIIKGISEENKNFYATLIMLSNHTPFTDIENYSDFSVGWDIEKVNEITGKKEKVTMPYMEGTTLGSYIKSVHYADEAIGDLIKDLDAQGLLENTAIVIYGDHDAKLKKSNYNKYYNYDPYTDSIKDSEDPTYVQVDYYQYEINRKVPFIIWQKNKKYNVEITEVMGMYDILPTLGNMLGIKSEYALGHDIFSVDENVVVFPDGNWITNKLYYNAQKNEGKYFNPDEPVSEEYIKKYTEYAEKLISVSDNIIVHDLIRKTKEKLEVQEQLNS